MDALLGTIDFTDRVALVTGAGGGMGRCYAIELARRGAAVVVDDYGGTIFGRAGDSSLAEAVVEEILALGGRAVASGEAVGTMAAAERLVGMALENFGRIDILVNNAGIAQPGAITDHDFAKVERVYATNLIGPHALMRAAWPAMREQGYGRILNITSNAALGIGGNAPYAGSKAGLIGLSLDAAREGAPDGILVNALMPVGYSRMIENVPDPEFVAWMQAHFQPEKVALAALFLLSADSTASGMIFTTGGGRLARVSFVVNTGLVISDITPEQVRDGIDRVLDLSDSTTVAGQADEIGIYTAAAAFDRASGPGLARDALVR